MAKSGPPGNKPHPETVRARLKAGWSPENALRLMPLNRRQAASLGARTSPWRHVRKA